AGDDNRGTQISRRRFLDRDREARTDARLGFGGLEKVAAVHRTAMAIEVNRRYLLNRGLTLGCFASSAFERKIRAPCDKKNSRSSGVKNDEPSGRGLKSSRRRPCSLKNRERISLRKNSQSEVDHSTPSRARPIRLKQIRCAVIKSNVWWRSGRGVCRTIRLTSRCTSVKPCTAL